MEEMNLLLELERQTGWYSELLKQILDDMEEENPTA